MNNQSRANEVRLKDDSIVKEFIFGFSLIALWLIWRPSPDHIMDMLVAALVPIIAWGSFFIAVRVPGSAAEDDPGSLPRRMGLPINLFNAGIFTLLSLFGFLLYYLGS